MTTPEETFDLSSLDGLPGADLVRQGLADFESEKLGIHALLIAAAPGYLRQLGVPVPFSADAIEEPELKLYHALCDSMKAPGDDPYYRYNSLRRELDSFISSLAQRRRREARSRAS